MTVVDDAVRITGNPAAADVAAVLAVLTARNAVTDAPLDGYAKWRATRLESLRHKASGRAVRHAGQM